MWSQLYYSPSLLKVCYILKILSYIFLFIIGLSADQLKNNVKLIRKSNTSRIFEIRLDQSINIVGDQALVASLMLPPDMIASSRYFLG